MILAIINGVLVGIALSIAWRYGIGWGQVALLTVIALQMTHKRG